MIILSVVFVYTFLTQIQTWFYSAVHSLFLRLFKRVSANFTLIEIKLLSNVDWIFVCSMFLHLLVIVSHSLLFRWCSGFQEIVFFPSDESMILRFFGRSLVSRGAKFLLPIFRFRARVVWCLYIPTFVILSLVIIFLMLFGSFSFVLWIEVIHHVWQEVNVVFVIDFLRREWANLTIFKRQLISQNPVLLLKKISFIKCSSLSNSLIDTVLITLIL